MQEEPHTQGRTNNQNDLSYTSMHHNFHHPFLIGYTRPENRASILSSSKLRFVPPESSNTSLLTPSEMTPNNFWWCIFPAVPHYRYHYPPRDFGPSVGKQDTNGLGFPFDETIEFCIKRSIQMPLKVQRRKIPWKETNARSIKTVPRIMFKKLEALKES